MEFYKKYRPKTLDEIIGQPTAVKTLQSFIKRKAIPKTILLTGPAGVGKTSIARILKDHLGCSKWDFHEINGASSRGIDTFREIEQKTELASMKEGSPSIWYIDEFQSTTKDFQESALKLLEDTPEHVYFFLAASRIDKILSTIKSRCTQINLQPIKEADLEKIVRKVAEDSGMEIDSEEVFTKIVECSNGSARKALVLLNSLVDVEDQLEALQKEDEEKTAWDLVQALLWKKQQWNIVAKILKDIDPGQAEGIRHLILKNATNEVLKSGKGMIRAYRILERFKSNFFDSGMAGLVAACFEIVMKPES